MNLIVVVDERVEEFCASRFRRLFPPTVTDVFVAQVLILQDKVVPVLSADKNAAVPVLQFKVVDALKDPRDAVTFAEIELSVIDATAIQ